MSAMASQITSLKIVYSNVYSGADQRKHQSSASLALVRGIHGSPVNSPHKGPVTRKNFHFMTSSWSLLTWSMDFQWISNVFPALISSTIQAMNSGNVTSFPCCNAYSVAFFRNVLIIFFPHISWIIFLSGLSSNLSLYPDSRRRQGFLPYTKP